MSISKPVYRIGVVLTAAVLFSLNAAIVLTAPAEASERDLIKKEKSLEDVKKQIREGKATVREIAWRERSILDELLELNKDLSSIKRDLGRTESRLKKIKGEMAAASARLEVLKKERAELKERMLRRLRSIYVIRNGAALGMLFSSASTEDLGRKHKYLSIIMDSDRELIGEVERNVEEVSREVGRVEAYKKEHERVLYAHKKKQKSAELKRRERARLLDRTKSERVEQERLVKELERAAKELTALIESLKVESVPRASSAFASMKGDLSLPVEGTIVQKYGKVTHPKFNTVTFNNGIIIRAPLGRTVKSVFGGRVAYVGRLKGYGQVLIIEHGGGFYTLFGQLFKVLKGKGEEVKKGEGVGLVGDSGLDEAPGLYFEVREGGVPRDPMAWFRTR